jgi:hypothetical protein
MRCTEIERDLENLGANDYDQVNVSPATEDYNCIAWAAGRTDKPWWPSKEAPFYYDWPVELPREEAGRETLENFIKAFQLQGYRVCRSSKHRSGIEKVALFAGSGGNPLHAARQLESGRWTSKCGDYEDIDHVNLAVMEGKVYGRALEFLERRRDGRPFFSDRIRSIVRKIFSD